MLLSSFQSSVILPHLPTVPPLPPPIYIPDPSPKHPLSIGQRTWCHIETPLPSLTLPHLPSLSKNTTTDADR